MPEPILNWSRQDIEQRLAFRGGRFTSVNTTLTMIVGTALAVAFYATLIPFQGTYFTEMFLSRGWVQYATVWLTGWAAAVLFFKWRKLRLQQRALQLTVVPTDVDFVLSAANVHRVTDQLYEVVDDPRQFVLLHRILIALTNLKNLGRVTDVDEILRSQADQDASAMETSYSLIQGFVWAIPVLGFIGTVLGLSQAIGGFGAVLGQADDISQLTDSLRGVTAGLAVAFETTLVALVAALVLQLLITFMKKSEEEFLDTCAEYCMVHVVNKLRTQPYESIEDPGSKHIRTE